MSNLSHHGVKGMKWGVINKDDVGSSTLQNHINEAKNHKFTKEQQAQIDKTKAQHDAKFGPSESDPKGWRPTGKQVAYTIAGAAAVGLILYGVKTNKASSFQLPTYGEGAPKLTKHFSDNDYSQILREVEKPTWLPKPGTKMEAKMYDGLVDSRSGHIWCENYVTRDLLNEKSFELPSGHQFFRLSSQLEHEFGHATYATTSEADLARYYATFTDGYKTKLVGFKSTSPIKVAHVRDQLDAMHDVIAAQHPGKEVYPEMVVSALHAHSGGSFATGEGRALVSTLRSRGFHGIVDAMDVGVYGEKPVVLFAPEKMTPKVTKRISSDYAKKLENMVTEIPNRR